MVVLLEQLWIPPAAAAAAVCQPPFLLNPIPIHATDVKAATYYKTSQLKVKYFPLETTEPREVERWGARHMKCISLDIKAPFDKGGPSCLPPSGMGRPKNSSRAKRRPIQRCCRHHSG